MLSFYYLYISCVSPARQPQLLPIALLRLSLPTMGSFHRPPV